MYNIKVAHKCYSVNGKTYFFLIQLLYFLFITLST